MLIILKPSENAKLKKTIYSLSRLLRRTRADAATLLDLEDIVGKGEENASEPENRSTSGGFLTQAARLSGHVGAIYTCAFSPTSEETRELDVPLLATGGFDRTVRLWNAEPPYGQLACLSGEHTLPISCIAWGWGGEGRRHLVSCGLDGCMVGWDTEAGMPSLSTRHLASGILNCVHCPLGNRREGQNLVYVGSASGDIHRVDIRTGKATGVWKASSAGISSLYTFGEVSVIAADRAGVISTWDTRIGQIVESLTLQGAPPIAHVTASPPDIGVLNPEWRNKQGVTACDHGDKCHQSDAVFEGYLLAANCYDGTLRILPRSGWGGLAKPKAAVYGTASNRNSIRVLRGHAVSGWPIQSCFFKGQQYRHEKFLERPHAIQNEAGGFGVAAEGCDWARSLVLASGSADGVVYTWNVSNGQVAELQALRGHTDSVYSVDFLQPSFALGGAYEQHQQPPSRLASCGADQTCIIWTAVPPIRSHSHRH